MKASFVPFALALAAIGVSAAPGKPIEPPCPEDNVPAVPKPEVPSTPVVVHPRPDHPNGEHKPKPDYHHDEEDCDEDKDCNGKPHPGWEHDSDYYFKKGKDGKYYLMPKFNPFTFTSTYRVVATPDQVVNGTTPTGGLPGAIGYYNFGINSIEDVICYNITLFGFAGDYQSPASTATHIHEAARGQSGPPRLSFPNPTPVDAAAPNGKRVSIGCLTGPFTTGLLANGTDTGVGFKVRQIEENPAGFFADVHSSQAVPGAVRGQLA